MKSLMLLPLVGFAFFASSCRTVIPLDPMTMKQSCKCMPGYYMPEEGGPCIPVICTK